MRISPRASEKSLTGRLHKGSASEVDWVGRAMKLLLATLSLCLAGASQAARSAPFASEVAVTREGARWTADFHFTGRSPLWMFIRSELTQGSERGWRAQSWHVETPGVRLERHNHHDALMASDGGPMPSRVRISFVPATIDHLAGYDPALLFTDGSVALYTENFVAFPQASAAAVDRLPRDLNGIEFPTVETRMTFRDAAGPVLVAGRRLRVATIRDDDADGTYVLFGPLQPIVTEAMSAVIDPQLPRWIHDGLARRVPDIFARYAAMLGPPPGTKPTIMVSWRGPTPGLVNMGGSALPSLITMTYEGAALTRETPIARGYGLYFIAHEAAHFWLGNRVTYQYARDSWITEGGADLLAFRTVAAVDPDYDWRAAVNESIRNCVTMSAGRGVTVAGEQGEQHVYYACGAVFGMIAEAASRRPFIEFVHRLVEDNRSDGVVSRSDWMTALDRVSGNRSLSRDIGIMLDSGAADPKRMIASLFRRAGIAFTPGDDGMPRVS
jgi:hypothetical protein